MTANNLGEHLSWLLRTKPSDPFNHAPPQPVVSNVTFAPVQREHDPTSVDAADSFAPSSTLVPEITPHPQVANPAMARLRPAPTSTVSQSPKTAVVTNTSSRQPSADSPSGRKHVIAARNVPLSGQYNKSTSNLEVLDLTEDTEHGVVEGGHGPFSVAGRKRKSEEMSGHDFCSESDEELISGAHVQAPAHARLLSPCSRSGPSRDIPSHETSTNPVHERLEIANSSDEAEDLPMRDDLPSDDPPPPYSTSVRSLQTSHETRIPSPAGGPLKVRGATVAQENPTLAAAQEDPSRYSTVVAESATSQSTSKDRASALISAEDAALLEVFMNLTTRQLQDHHDTAVAKRELSVSAFMEAIDQEDPHAEAVHFPEQSRAKSVVDALETLQKHQAHLQALETSKKTHLHAIRKAVVAGATERPDTEGLARVKAQLFSAKIQCLSSLRTIAHLLQVPQDTRVGRTTALEEQSSRQPSNRDVSARHDNVTFQTRIRPIQRQSFSPPVAYEQQSIRPQAVNARSERLVGTSLNSAARKVDFDPFNLGDDDAGADELFDTVMGRPPAQACDPDNIYDEFASEDDEDLFELIEDPGAHKSTAPTTLHRGQNRPVFSEISTNVAGRSTGSQLVNTQNAAADFSHAWSNDVKRALKEMFHLKGFRSNQLNAVNATLAGKNVFVLMPTGGGKSLCYQLPAVVASGKTRGVTVVISPLLSLMHDQVTHLVDLGIKAAMINGNTPAEEKTEIFRAFNRRDPEDYLQILYVTPEMLTKNQRMLSVFEQLHQRNKFARLVIDEAHCVSQWGHDFRPDYTMIGDIKSRFAGLPLMALTATATENVKQDVINNLGIRGCEVYSQSFNRPNLYYEVRNKPKGAGTLDAIANIIKSREYAGKCGIVYCFSRKKCEIVAEALRKKYKIRAQHYHAHLEPQKKAKAQEGWQNGRIQVIVATIAFGMGIDKPDVRFVIHHSLPMSLEGYYQETGRAGRDSKRSGCFLFYSYADTNFMNNMIDEGEGSYEQKERKRAMLRNMIAFCENKADCRRVQVLGYFSEKFPRERCQRECDNCNSTAEFKLQDFTSEAKNAIELVRALNTAPREENVTLIRCVDILRGVRGKANAGYFNLDQFGSASTHHRSILERLLQSLLSMDILAEDRHTNRAGFNISYMRLGRMERNVSAGSRKITLSVHVSAEGDIVDDDASVGPSARKSGTKSQPAAGPKGKAKRKAPLSTNVSSPAQARAPRRKAKQTTRNSTGLDDFVASDGYSDAGQNLTDAESMDGFEPVRNGAVQRGTRRQSLGAPITADQRMESLPEIHRALVEQFVEEGKSTCHRILVSKNLKTQPFSESNLREMAIRFPDSLDAMARLPNMDNNKVQTYGKQFLAILRRYRQNYQEMMQEDSAGRALEDEVVQDPNHEVVINLCTDDEDDEDEGGDKMGDNASDDEDYGSLDGDFEEQLAESSAYFQRGSTSARHQVVDQRSVKTARSSMIHKGKGSTNAPRQRPRQRPAAKHNANGERGIGANGKTSRKVSAGSSRPPASRVSKKAGGRTRKSNHRSSSDLSSFLYRGQGNEHSSARRGGINMMPT